MTDFSLQPRSVGVLVGHTAAGRFATWGWPVGANFSPELDNSAEGGTCEVCGRQKTPKRYDHESDHRIYWTCDLAEAAWAHGAQHTAEDAPENRKARTKRKHRAERAGRAAN